MFYVNNNNLFEDFHCFCTFFLETAVVLRCNFFTCVGLRTQTISCMSFTFIFKVETFRIVFISNLVRKGSPQKRNVLHAFISDNGCYFVELQLNRMYLIFISKVKRLKFGYSVITQNVVIQIHKFCITCK